MRIAELPLHYGKAPKWLFKRMVKLADAIIQLMVYEFGTKKVLKRLSDPFWFQALSCTLGFDWHSSGTTTTTCGALKEAINNASNELGMAVAGGKGNVARKAPEQIKELCGSNEWSFDEKLVYASRMSAKVDNTLIQDGYELYHHVIFFDENSNWCVIQQGMNTSTKYARRYHWDSEINCFVYEPQKAICCDRIEKEALNMCSKKSEETRKASLELVCDSIERLKREWLMLKGQKTLYNWNSQNTKIERLVMPLNINWEALRKAYEFQPKNYEEFISIRGIGPETVRALAYISELIYGTEADWKDPVKYSFTVGGKDGVPFPVKKQVMDKAIEFLEDAIKQAKLKDYEKKEALKRLKKLAP